MSPAENLARALQRATAAIVGDQSGAGLVGSGLALLERGGITIAEVDLSSTDVLAGDFELKAVRGYGLRMLRHGSNPGARLEMKFGNNVATKFFAPGQAIKGGFETARVKLAANSARVGKATFAVLNEHDTDLTEDLLISAIGPVDLLGSCDPTTGDPKAWVTVPENTDPTTAYATQVGAFDGSGWELLRVLVRGDAGATFTTADIHFFQNPSWTGTTWFDCGLDGLYQVPDAPTSGYRYRSFLVGWGGRGIGYPGVYNLLPAPLTGLDIIIQGLK